MSTRRSRQSAQQWAIIVEQFEQSNLSAAAFCKQHDIAAATFSKWRHRKKQESAVEVPAFKQINTAMAPTNSSATSASIITLQVGRNLTLTIASEPVTS